MTSRNQAPHVGRHGDTQRGAGQTAADVIILIAMAVLAVAASLALHLQGGLGTVTAALLAAGLFFLTATVHVLKRRLERMQQSDIDEPVDLHEELANSPPELSSAGAELAAVAATMRELEVHAPAPTRRAARAPAAPFEPSLIPIAPRASIPVASAKAAPAPTLASPAAPDDEHGWGEEPGAIDNLVRQLAAELDVADASNEASVAPVPHAAATSQAPLPALPKEQAVGAGTESEQPLALSAVSGNARLAEAVQRAAGGDIEIHLQPIVAFADRKARLYEVHPRIADAGGLLIDPLGYKTTAASMGLSLAIERAALLRCTQIQRRLSEKGRAKCAVFRLSSEAIRDRAFLQRLIADLAPDPLLADLILLEIDQHDIEEGGATERENMDLLAASGFRFSLGCAETLALESEELTARSIAFVRVSPGVLSQEPDETGAAHLREAGIETILVEVEDEAAVQLGQRHGIVLGEGLLFSGPKPLRSSVAKPAQVA